MPSSTPNGPSEDSAADAHAARPPAAPPAAPGEARLEELERPASAESQGWDRLKAGMLVEGGRCDRKLAKRWQERVIAGDWSPDEAAAELLAAGPAVPDDDPELRQRTARLMRDLVMAPKLKGAAGAARAARKAGRNLFAYVLTQLMVLSVFALILVAGLVVARWRGVRLDPLLDKVVAYLPAPPDSAAAPADE